MPDPLPIQTYSRTTPFGTQRGLVSPGEALAQQQALAQNQLLAQAQIEQLRQTGETSRQGTYGQRSSGEMAMQTLRGGQEATNIGLQGDIQKGLAQTANVPALGAQQLARDQWSEGGDVRRAEGQARLHSLQLDQQMQDSIFNPGASPGGATPAQKPAGFGYGLPSASEAAGLSLDGGAATPPPAVGAGISALRGNGPDQSMLDRVGLYRYYKGGEDPRIAAQQMTLRDLQVKEAQRKEADAEAQGFLGSGQTAEANAVADASHVPRPHVAGTALATDPTMQQKLGELSTAVNSASSMFGRGDVATVQQKMQQIIELGKAQGYLPEDVKAWLLSSVDKQTQSSPLWQFLRRNIGVPAGLPQNPLPSASEAVRGAVGLPGSG